MNFTKQHTSYIITAFEKMRSKADLLELLNYAKKLIYGEKAYPFELKQLTLHAYQINQ